MSSINASHTLTALEGVSVVTNALGQYESPVFFKIAQTGTERLRDSCDAPKCAAQANRPCHAVSQQYKW